jgi:hypothetical protein
VIHLNSGMVAKNIDCQGLRPTQVERSGRKEHTVGNEKRVKGPKIIFELP